MADIIANAQSWLAQKQKTHLSRPIIYRRGGVWVELQAMVGRWEYEQTNFDGGLLRAECRDYLFLADDLELDGELTLPLSGDLVEEVVDGKRFIYEIVSPGNEPCYRLENNRSTIRVHVKDKRVENLV